MQSPQHDFDFAQIRMPKGGGSLKGVTETFQASQFTGVGHFSIPVDIPGARGLTPDLNLTYSAGSGQGVFGIGFSLSIPQISRRTEKRLPNYSDDDEFVLSEAEYLVPALKPEHGAWIPDTSNRTEEGETFHVQRYLPRTEGQFLNIEKWTDFITGNVHWRIMSPDGLTRIYGKSETARIAHPDNPEHTFRWFLETTFDSKGNQIAYSYLSENGDAIPKVLSEQNRGQPTQKYLHKIQYGNYFDDLGNTQWAFSIVFDYGNYGVDQLLSALQENDTSLDLTGLSTAPTQLWDSRPDPFSDYRAGFEIRTHRRCHNILVFHHFKELEVQDYPVRAMRLSYRDTSALSLLTTVQQIGFRRQADGTYETCLLPPVSFTYSGFEPEHQAFQPITVDPFGRLAGQFNPSGYQLLDLYGEGLSGILYDQQGTPLYLRSRGDGRFYDPEPIDSFPSEQYSLDRSAHYRLEDGQQTHLVVNTSERSGFYTLADENDWTGWQPFEAVALEQNHPGVELADVTGSGFPDLLLFEDERIKVYPDARAEGHRPALMALRAGDMPTTQNPDPLASVLLVDMVGDGLSDRVRVRNGNVTYWPNLGYGKFGAPVSMDNAPVFEDQFDPTRLLVGDLDGSGTTDFVYVRSGVVEVYLNQSGNRFAAPIQIPLPHRYHPGSHIQLADIAGNGTTCLVFSYGTKTINHRFYDFSGGNKPYLLNQIDNHSGALTRIQYAPSTQFYLQDRAAGRPWITRLPFPLQVVERIETVDLIASSKQVVRYAYHHGAFDLREREFAGFGLVESWDSESFEQFAETDLTEAEAYALPEAELHVPPIHRKTWYHNGLAEREDALSLQFAAEYYPLQQTETSPGSGTLGIFSFLADSDFEAVDGETQSLQSAYRALRGKVLREEIYADDDSDQASHPYQVQEYAYRLRLVQPEGAPVTDVVHARPLPQYSVYLPLRREEISYDFERNPNDPRIRHGLFLEYDAYGNLTRQAELVYARQKPQQADPTQQRLGQNRTQGIYTHQSFVNWINPSQGVYRPGILIEAQGFELAGLDQALDLPPGSSSGLKTWETLSREYAQLEQTAVDVAAVETTQVQQRSRLVSWKRYRYWNRTFSEVLPVTPWDDGLHAAPQVLLARIETAVASQTHIEHHFTDLIGFEEVNSKLLSQDSDGGAFQAHLRSATGQLYYFDPGITAHYGKVEQFYQPIRYVDQFGTETLVTYDDYQLAILQTEAKLSATQSLVDKAEIDYGILQPRQVIDPNSNTTEYRYDPLGRLRRVSRYGKEDDGDAVRNRGDEPLAADPAWRFPGLDEVVTDPAKYLGNSTTLFIYDLQAWDREGQPIYALTLQRDRYTSDLEAGAASAVQIMLEYSDGFGRSVQQKSRAEAGAALQVQANGSVATVETEHRWIVTGRTVFNNKGAVIKQYEPFYSDSARYQSEQSLTEHGVTVVQYYDPLGRVVRIVAPKGYETRTEYSPWQIQQFDENDTILESAYYRRFGNEVESSASLSEDERDALAKATHHADTPTIEILDVWGRTVVLQEQARAGEELRETFIHLDILGNRLKLQSPRWANTDNFDFQTEYDMVGHPLWQLGLDNGEQWSLHNAGGDIIHHWNGRGFHTITHYDALSRPTAIWVRGNGLNHQIERIEYGEQLDPKGDRNLRGKVALHYDSAGSLAFPRYGLDDQWLRCDRRFRADYKTEPNWDNQDDRTHETLTITREFDALNRLTQIHYPDGRKVAQRYHLSSRLQAVDLIANNRAQPIITAITYNARDQRTQVQYGNGTTTTFGYDPLTFELVQLQSRRNQDGRYLQDLRHTYDPVGNITRQRDLTQQSVFTNNQRIDPFCDYTYDALYQLVKASGREHPGLYNNRPQTELPDYGQLFDINYDLNNGQALDRYIRNYTYDRGGNLTRVEHRAGRTQYTRENKIDGQSNRLQNLTYDASGNPQSLKHLQTLSWNSRNQLARADIIRRQNAASDSEYYSYTFTGQRVRKVIEIRGKNQTEITETLYFGDYSIQRIKQGNRVQQERSTITLNHGQDRIAVAHRWPIKRRAELPDAQVRFQLGNLQGSVALELDTRSNVISYEEYYPFGGTALVAGQAQREVDNKLYRFSGQERDAVTHLYCYGSRYYATWLGRWLSPDLAGPVDGPNLYAFVSNNPIRYRDEGGFNKEDVNQGIAAGKPARRPQLKRRNAIVVAAPQRPRLQRRNAMVISPPQRPRLQRRNAVVGASSRRPQLRRRNAFIGQLPQGQQNGAARPPLPRPQLKRQNVVKDLHTVGQATTSVSIGNHDQDTLILVATAILVGLYLLQKQNQIEASVDRSQKVAGQDDQHAQDQAGQGQKDQDDEKSDESDDKAKRVKEDNADDLSDIDDDDSLADEEDDQDSQEEEEESVEDENEQSEEEKQQDEQEDDNAEKNLAEDQKKRRQSN